MGYKLNKVFTSTSLDELRLVILLTPKNPLGGGGGGGRGLFQ